MKRKSTENNYEFKNKVYKKTEFLSDLIHNLCNIDNNNESVLPSSLKLSLNYFIQFINKSDQQYVSDECIDVILKVIFTLDSNIRSKLLELLFQLSETNIISSYAGLQVTWVLMKQFIYLTTNNQEKSLTIINEITRHYPENYSLINLSDFFEILKSDIDKFSINTIIDISKFIKFIPINCLKLLNKPDLIYIIVDFLKINHIKISNNIMPVFYTLACNSNENIDIIISTDILSSLLYNMPYNHPKLTIINLKLLGQIANIETSYIQYIIDINLSLLIHKLLIQNHQKTLDETLLLVSYFVEGTVEQISSLIDNGVITLLIENRLKHGPLKIQKEAIYVYKNILQKCPIKEAIVLLNESIVESLLALLMVINESFVIVIILDIVLLVLSITDGNMKLNKNIINIITSTNTIHILDNLQHNLNSDLAIRAKTIINYLIN